MNDITPHETLLDPANHQQNANIPQNALIPLTQIDLRQKDYHEVGLKAGWESEHDMSTHGGELFLESLFPTSRSVNSIGAEQVVRTSPAFLPPSMEQGGIAPDFTPARPVTPQGLGKQLVRQGGAQGVKAGKRLWGFRNGSGR